MTTMTTFTFAGRQKVIAQVGHSWLRWCSIGALLISVVFLGISIFAYNYYNEIVSKLVPILIVALSSVISLNLYTLWHLRSEHRDEDRAFRDADCEFSSIFQNVLDGILIVDSDGKCLDANPAAASILRCASNDIVGQTIADFFVAPAAFRKGWAQFLEKGNSRGRAHLVAGDR